LTELEQLETYGLRIADFTLKERRRQCFALLVVHNTADRSHLATCVSTEKLLQLLIDSFTAAKARTLYIHPTNDFHSLADARATVCRKMKP